MNLRTTSSATPEVLDPCQLGRPVHLLPAFAAEFRNDLSELFRTGLNRRYRATFQVDAVTVSSENATPWPARWWTSAGEVGSIGFALDRSVLLAALHYRYGAQADAATASPNELPVRETATEERLAAMLGAQLTQALATRIDASLGVPAAAHVFDAAVIGPAPAAGTWVVRVAIREHALGVNGHLCLSLDEAWMARLLRHLLVTRAKPKERSSAGKPLAERLNLTLSGRLLRKEIPLGELLDIRLGDVIPVNLGATEVLIDDSHVFRAVVAERSGKLCLTSFEDME